MNTKLKKFCLTELGGGLLYNENKELYIVEAYKPSEAQKKIKEKYPNLCTTGYGLNIMGFVLRGCSDIKPLPNSKKYYSSYSVPINDLKQ